MVYTRIFQCCKGFYTCEMGSSQHKSPPHQGRAWCGSAHLTVPNDKICKRCSFECGIRKYSTRPRNKVWAFRRTPYFLDKCFIFPYRTKMNTVCIFSHNCPKLLTAVEVYSGPKWQTTRWWIADAHSIAFTCYTAYIQYVYMKYNRVRYWLLPTYVS